MTQFGNFWIHPRARVCNACTHSQQGYFYWPKT